MSIIKKKTVLSEVLAQHHILIPIVNRFGIRLGVGDKTIESICKEQNLNIDFYFYLFDDIYDLAIEYLRKELLDNYFAE